MRIRADAETQKSRIKILRSFRRSCRLLNSNERRGKVCAVCGVPYGKYELHLLLETSVDPEFFVYEAGTVYACNLCYLKLSQV